MGCCKSSYLGRITDSPFMNDSENSFYLKAMGDQNFLQNKSTISMVFSYLQLHPCYIVNILKFGGLDYEAQTVLLKTLYTSNKKTDTVRLNFLLISVFEKMLPYELGKKSLRTTQVDVEKDMTPEFIDLFSEKQDPPMISTFIFRFIFQSQYTNIDTVCCILCHMVNTIITQFAQNSSGESGEDATLDVADECGGDSKDGKKGGGGGGAADKKKKVNQLVEFLKIQLETIRDN